MDRLKKILRQALSENAQRIKLQVAVATELTSEQGARPLTDDPPADEEYIFKLYGFLFPNDKSAIGLKQLAKGALNVPGVGKILLIAQPSAPASLRLYPPAGQALYDSDWAKLNNKTVAPPPPPAGGQIGFGHGGPMNIFDIPSDLAGITAKPQAVHAPLAAPIAVPDSGMAGGIAPPLFGVSTDNGAAASRPSVAALPAVSSIPDVFATQPPAQMHPHIVQPARDHGGHGHGHGQINADDPIPEINFAAEADGESSSGQNPIDPILIDMIKRKASDVHMTAGEPICMRIDGEIHRVSDAPVSPQQMASLLLPIFPERNQREFHKINDTDFAYEVKGVGRFRVNIFRDKNGVGTVMRHIPSKIMTSEQLGLSPAIMKFCLLTKGLVLVTGPTGSGKSTTLAAMLDWINKNRHDHLLTVEDPIEFVHPQQRCLVNQREVHKHTGSFSRALKAALREDPDIVLIGEMRDLETIAIAIETAETGHLVFGTLHTTTAVSTIDRIIDQFPSDRQEQIRMMLSSGLKGVVAQTLLKKKGGGRVAAQEILVMTDAVSAMIREGKNHMIPNHMQSQKQDGNILLNECLAKLVKDGVVDPEDAYRKAVDKTSLLELYKRIGIKYGEAQAAPQQAKRPA